MSGRGVNVWYGIGNVTATPELRYTKNGTGVTNFTIACNEKRGGEEFVLFLKCVAWDKAAETICDYVIKGDPLYVQGRLRINRWEDKEGIERETPECNVFQFNFLGNKRDREEDPEPDNEEEYEDDDV